MQTIGEIIKKLGGTSAVAAELSLTPSTVSSWKSSGRVPGWRRDALIAVAVKKGVALSDADFTARAEQRAA